DQVTFLDDITRLESIFFKRAQRKVKLDGTITLNRKLYEVPAAYIGQKVDLRIDEKTVYIFEEGKEMIEAIPVSFHDNAHIKRKQSPFTVPDAPTDKGESVDV